MWSEVVSKVIFVAVGDTMTALDDALSSRLSVDGE